MFFFPETMVERVINISAYLLNNKEYEYEYTAYYKLDESLKKRPLDQPLLNFNFHCREYLGFGFLASFLPGTNAYEARKDLSSEIDKQINLINELIREPDGCHHDVTYLFTRLQRITLLKGAVVDKLLLRPLWEILGNICKQYFFFPNITSNKKYSIEELISFIPPLGNIYPIENEENEENEEKEEKDILSEFFEYIRNPLHLVDKALFFLYLLLNRILEIGSKKDKKSGLIRSTLKGLLAGIFSLIAIPLKIGIKILDIPFDLLKNIIYRPLRFVLLSAFKCCKIEPFKPIHNHNHTYRGEDYTPPSSSFNRRGIESTEREPADADLYPNLTNNTA